MAQTPCNSFKMRDYHVLSMDRIGGEVTVHPVALDIQDVPWAARQMWAPDAAYKDGTFYLYFPAKDKAGAFRIGDIRHNVADLSCSRKLLGFAPKWSFMPGLRSFLEWAAAEDKTPGDYSGSLAELRERGLMNG